MKTRKIILEDGTEYLGKGFGSDKEKKLELVFNTSVVGYQEIITDPSYTDQAVVMTYPIIGNYGINDDDNETGKPSIGALIVREYADKPSNFRTSKTLSEFMDEHDIAGVYGIDTRELTRRIRGNGSCKVLITGENVTAEEGRKILDGWEYESDQVKRVSTDKAWTSDPENADENTLHVVAIDCGIKLNIVRMLNEAGCRVTVLPWDVDFETLKQYEPDGVFFSNGPGNPEDAVPTIELMRKVRGAYPVFGICLGHQIMALAYGAKTYKLKFGHRGGNHPVRNLLTDKLEITSQNHSYAVDEASLEGTGLEVTHINLLDKTVEGMQCAEDRAFSIQYHPESCPGPQDSKYLFEKFVKVMKGGALNA